MCCVVDDCVVWFDFGDCVGVGKCLDIVCLWYECVVLLCGV